MDNQDNDQGKWIIDNTERKMIKTLILIMALLWMVSTVDQLFHHSAC